MKSKYYTAIFLSAALFLSACQSTPVEQSVVGKREESDITSKPEASVSEETVEWKQEKDYGKSCLYIDAKMITPENDGITIAHIASRKWEDSELESTIRALFPEGEIYADGARTKAEVQDEIVYTQMKIANWDDNRPTQIESITRGDGSFESNVVDKEYLQKRLEQLGRELEQVPEHQPDLEGFALEYDANSRNDKAGYRVENKDGVYRLFFSNGVAPMFRVDALEDPSFSILTEDEEIPQSLTEQAEEVLDKLGIDYMQPSIAYDIEWFSDAEEGTTPGRSLYFTRHLNGLGESVSIFNALEGIMGEGAKDKVAYIDVWQTEYMQFDFQGEELVAVTWKNPSILGEVKNQSADILPMEDIQQRFMQYIDRVFGYEAKAAATHGINMYVTQARLNLHKLKIRDTNEYRLMPVWTFYGYVESQYVAAGSDKGSFNLKRQTIVDINAIDGSIVDRDINTDQPIKADEQSYSLTDL